MFYSNQYGIQSATPRAGRKCIDQLYIKRSLPPICEYHSPHKVKFKGSSRIFNVAHCKTMLNDVGVGFNNEFSKCQYETNEKALFSFDGNSDDESFCDSSLNSEEGIFNRQSYQCYEDDDLYGLAFSDDVDISVDKYSIFHEQLPCLEESDDDELIGLSFLCSNNNDESSISSTLEGALTYVESIFKPSSLEDPADNFAANMLLKGEVSSNKVDPITKK